MQNITLLACTSVKLVFKLSASYFSYFKKYTQCNKVYFIIQSKMEADGFN